MARHKRRLRMPSMPEMESDVKRGIIIVLIFLVAVLSLFSIFDMAGGLGRFFYSVLKYMFGWGFWIFPIVLIAAGYLSVRTTRYSFENINWVGMFLLIIGYSGFFHLTQEPALFKEILAKGVGGGCVGFAIAWPLVKIMGRWAAMAVSLAIFLIGLILMFNTSLESILEKVTFKRIRERLWGTFGRFRQDSSEEDEGFGETEEEEVEFEEKEIEDTKENHTDKDAGEADDRQELSSKKVNKKKFPLIDIPLSLLNGKVDKPTAGDIKFYQETIRKTLLNFGIEVEMGEVSVGPTVTQYTFRPAEGVKLSRIIGLGNDLALALAAHPIRIEAPIPGKSLVGIEVPNKKIAVVPLRKVIETKEFKNRKSNLSICLGQDVAGKPWIINLSKLPHLLVAGQTGSGKTVCLNSIIISLLYQNQPNELKFILVDPKRVDMPVFNGIPHLLTPVIVDLKKTINALKWTISEMERRFSVLSNAGKRNIQSYNITHPRDKMPYLVFIIDELADLMSTASAEVEAAVIRLAQMSRAVGIHLILATQRPSVDIITGLIKANIPGRVAFAVASLTDSRTILDVSGAEKLLGRGDMLFSSAEISKPKRLQGAYCSDEDIEKVVEFLRECAGPEYEESVIEKVPVLSLNFGGRKRGLSDSEEGDDLLEDARDLVIEAGKASASYLQRRLKIGYARAARILDLLEAAEIIGPADGSKPREVLVKKGEKSLVEQADEIINQESKIGEQELREGVEKEDEDYPNGTQMDVDSVDERQKGDKEGEEEDDEDEDEEENDPIQSQEAGMVGEEENDDKYEF